MGGTDSSHQNLSDIKYPSEGKMVFSTIYSLHRYMQNSWQLHKNNGGELD